MQDALYYTFSTIPQVLAGTIALLGVFWVYKIKDYNNQLKSLMDAFLREIDKNDKHKWPTTNKLKNLLEVTRHDVKRKYTEIDIERIPYRTMSSMDQGDFTWIYKTIGQVYSVVPDNGILENVMKKFLNIDNDKRILTKNTKATLILAGIQIILSVVLLIFTPIIICYKAIPIIIMVLSIAYFGYLVFFTVKTIIDALKIDIIKK